MAARRLRAVAGHIGSASSGGGRPFTAAAATAVQKDLVVQKRGAAAIVGCLVADAAATPSHWVYDQSSLAQSATRETAAFMEPINPFYHIVPGNVLPKPPSHNIARIATCLGRVAAAGAPPTTHMSLTRPLTSSQARTPATATRPQRCWPPSSRPARRHPLSVPIETPTTRGEGGCSILLTPPLPPY